jgi:amino acid transporter
MRKRIPNIIIITAGILTLIALTLDLTNVGENWKDIWQNFEIKRFLLVIIILCFSGLVLGLFVFRKLKYLKRIKLTIPIAFIFFSLYDLTKAVDYHYGLSEYYNYFTAKKDLKEGKVQILTAGFLVSSDSEKTVKAKDSIRMQFGFTFLNVGIYSEGLKRYNEVIEKYLTEKNGENWRKRLQFKIDSLDKLQND